MKERQFAGNPATAVYGTIIVAGQLAIESATDHSVGTMLVSLLATAAVFWVAHAYTEVLGETITAGGLTASFRHALRVDLPIAESALIPAVVLGVVAAFGASARHAATSALVVAALELVGWAVLAGRRTGVTGGRRLAYTLSAAAFGAVIIALKFALH